MNFALDENQNALRREIIRFAEAELNDGACERDREQQFPHDLWMKCGEMGLPGLPVDERYGGRGLDPLTSAIALEALGYGCHDNGLVFAICAHLLACVVPIWRHGTEDQKQKYLPGLCNGTLIAANGMTEPGAGSDPFSMSTRAEPDGDGFRINGTKVLISNAPVADVALVYAVTDPAKGYNGGVTGFVIETGTEGLRVGREFTKMSLRTCQMGELLLEDVYVPSEAVLGGVGAGAPIFSESMEWERICIAAAHVGEMERFLERAVARARTQTAFGQRIGTFQAVSHRIADMKVRLEAGRWLTYKAAWRLGKARDIAMDASIAKTFVSESLLTSALDTVRTFGGYGVLEEHGIERGLRDSVAGTLYSGTNDMQRNIIARWLGL